MIIRHRHRALTGFTIVEVLVAIAIFVVVMASVSFFQANVFSYQRSISGSYTTVQDAQILLRTMNRELRTMSAGDDGAYALTQAATSSITFFSDLKNDGTRERVRYFLYKGALYKGVIQPTGSPATYPIATEASTTLVLNMRNGSSTPVFEYFDGTYNGTSSPLTQPVNVGAVRLIKINLVLDTDPNQSPIPRTYSTQVSLRNLKDNL